MLNKRVSCVEVLKIVSTDKPSIIELGDSDELKPLSYAIAVQREQAIFKQNEFNFRDYSIFSRSLTEPISHESVNMNRMNESPVIRVGYLDIFNVSSSGIVHIGSSRTLEAETRIKHIRHLFRERQATL